MSGEIKRSLAATLQLILGKDEALNELDVSYDGLLESFDVNLAEAQELVMTARLMLGWVTEEQLAEDAAAEEGEAEEGETSEESEV